MKRLRFTHALAPLVIYSVLLFPSLSVSHLVSPESCLSEKSCASTLEWMQRDRNKPMLKKKKLSHVKEVQHLNYMTA